MTEQIRKAVGAYKAAAQLGNCQEPRLQLSTPNAVKLARHLIDVGVTLRHPEKVLEAVDAFEALYAAEVKSGTEAALLLGTELGKAAQKFWDAFEGEPVDGVEILRQRA